jgi:protein-S-isoprenylcysteine O-methyltransferase Ste14
VRLPGGGAAGLHGEDAPVRLNRSVFGKLAYGALFTVLLPALLVLWAARLDRLVPLPAYASPIGGGSIALLGLALMAAATAALWIHGHGLPMSAYPPARFVTSGVYRYLSNPIYVGAVLVTVGLALAAGSAAGLWLVSPLLALAAAAWVLGFERAATRAHFGDAVRPPLLRLPPPARTPPTGADRAAVLLLVFLPWALLYEAVEFLGVPPDAIIAWRAWDLALPVIPWTQLLYLLAYPAALAVPWVAASRADLRWFMVRGWVATALILPFYLLLPVIAPAKPVEGAGVLEAIMRWERAYDEPVTAFPSFHVVWMVLAACIFTRRWPRLAPLWWLTAAAVSVSCVTVGMHAAADILAGAVAALLIVRVDRLWEWARRGAERVANGWHEVRVGPVRLINHGAWAAAGGAAGVLAAVALAGSGYLWPILGISAAAVVGAAVWAQLVEGSPQLLRPYGYYGSVLGVLIGVVVAALFGADPWLLLAAFAVGASLTQAIGRGRCLVQGCCHGTECPAWLGIRFTHPRSRVTRLSDLGGRPLHPTQLYSAGWMLLVAAVLLRLWKLGAGTQFIVGLYFLLVGIGRFVEEHYRGEPQTAVWGGLRLYQWLAIGFVVVGGVVTTLGWSPAPTPVLPGGREILATLVFGALAYVAYGVDFPGLSTRFSRLV